MKFIITIFGIKLHFEGTNYTIMVALEFKIENRNFHYLRIIFKQRVYEIMMILYILFYE